jgi:hypothetical protein
VFLGHAEFYDDLKARGLVRCLVCGSERTEFDPQLFPLRSMKPDDDPTEPTGLSQLTAMLVCRDCGFVRLHAVNVGKTPVDDLT